MAFLAPLGGSLILNQQAKKQQQKQQARVEDLARQTQAGVQQATALTPLESSLRDTTLQALLNRQNVPGETLYGRQGPVSAETAAQILKRVQNPGMDFTDTTGLQTQRALEEGVFPTFAARGISPQSPIVAEASRREARDIAIQNALGKLSTIQSDIGRGEQFGRFASALEDQARTQGLNLGEMARARQAQGGVTGAELKAGILNPSAQQNVDFANQERQASRAKVSQTIFDTIAMLEKIAAMAAGGAGGGADGGAGGGTSGIGQMSPQFILSMFGRR